MEKILDKDQKNESENLINQDEKVEEVEEKEMEKIIKLQNILNNDNNKFWEDLQKYNNIEDPSLPHPECNNFTHQLSEIFIPLNCLVHEICSKLLVKQHIIWIVGPHGVGKTSCTKRFQNYGFMAMDGEDQWNNKADGRLITNHLH